MRLQKCGIAAVGFLWLTAACIRADDKLPTDLAAIPGDGIGFIHLRVGEVLEGESMKPVRELIMKAGPAAIKAFNDRFVPAPLTLDRLTLIILKPDNGAPEPPIVVIAGTSKPFDSAKVVSAGFPKAQVQKSGMTTYHVDPENDIGIKVLDDRHILFGPATTVGQYLLAKPAPAGIFAAAIKDAQSKSLTIALNTGMLPGEAIAELPPPLQPLARAQMLHATLQIEKESKFDLHLHYASDAAAKAGEGALQEGVAMAREELKKLKKDAEDKVYPKKPGEVSPYADLPEAAVALVALGAITQLDDYLAKLPVQHRDATLQASITIPQGPFGTVLATAALGTGFALPAVQKVRMAAARSQSSNNLKQIALALHNYHDTYNQFPAAAICDKNGKPLLSWRVAILPYIEQDVLYRQFKLDEPWDSEHNKKLGSVLVKVFTIPGIAPPGQNLCHYRVFYGKGAIFDLRKGTRIADIADGTSNTFMIVEAEEGVPWTKPDELEYDPEKPLPKLGKQYPDVFQAAFADGSVRVLQKKLAEKTIRALITRNGGEVIGNDLR
jgi:hypothetical protein